MSAPAIELRDLCVSFRTGKGLVHAVDHLTLAVPRGSVLGFVGPNGAGKTTTINVLLGFIAATGGEARIFGEPVSEHTARERIGYLSENPDTYRFLSGRELLLLTGRLFDLPRERVRSRAEALLADVGLAEAADRRIATYSRGMRQRICLAQALLNDPDLLILDEVTGGLDPIGRLDIRRIIDRCRAQGKTVFMSSHELSEIELVCDRIAVLARGRLLAEGPTATFLEKHARLEQYFVDLVTSPARPEGAPA